jgi:hypothetical protein
LAFNSVCTLYDSRRVVIEQQFISEARAKAKADLATAQQSLKDLEAATIP